MEDSTNGETPSNSRQPPKREGDPDDQEGQPVPKRASPSESIQEPPSAGSANPATENVDGSMQIIFAALEQVVGQSMVDLAHLFVRNEEVLRDSVQSLRQALRLHQGHMEPCIEEFLVALGPGSPAAGPSVTPSSRDAPSVPQEVEEGQDQLPETGSVMSVRSAKEVLRRLGRILDTLAESGDTMAFNNRSEGNGQIDRNGIAHTFAGVLYEIGEHLQFTYRSSLSTLAATIEKRLPKWKSRMDAVITKFKSSQVTSQLEARPMILQLFPRVCYPDLPEPNSRYRMMVPRGDFHSELPERIYGQPSENSELSCNVNRGEDTLLFRYGSEQFVSGQRTVSIDYSVQGIQFRIFEAFSSNGWVDPEGSEGQVIRWLEFNVTQFERGTDGYRIEERESQSPSGQGGTQFVIIVSGIPNQNVFAALGQRIEFLFVLPDHLTRKHINDVGIRDGLIKVQFAK